MNDIKEQSEIQLLPTGKSGMKTGWQTRADHLCDKCRKSSKTRKHDPLCVAESKSVEWSSKGAGIAECNKYVPEKWVR